MSFPLISLFSINGGLLIALVAVIHVFVAQFAVGGGFFLLLAERLAHKQHSPQLLQWVQKHATFFLLLTTVFGGLTGVSIWFTTALVSPEGMAFLVNRFAYVWAAEWAFFLGEIVALMLYHASFKYMKEGTIDKRQHAVFAWGYCIFAFLSLAVINGIVSFMLTTGTWTPSDSMWVAFFNPSYWSSLVFRTFLCFCLAGLFGLITATRIKDAATRRVAVTMCARWIVVPLVGVIASAFWYKQSLPVEILVLMERYSADIHPFIRAFVDTIPLLLLGGILFFIKMPQKAYPPLVVVMLLMGLIVAGSYEWVREAARRPWLVHNVIYSNGITPAQGALLQKQGLLHSSGWVQLAVAAQDLTLQKAHAVVPAQAGATNTMQSLLEHTKLSLSVISTLTSASPSSLQHLNPQQKDLYGKMIYLGQCATCHGLGAPRLDLVPRVAGKGLMRIDALLTGQGKISPYMPPFFATPAEKELFAQWLNDLPVPHDENAQKQVHEVTDANANADSAAVPPAQEAAQPSAAIEPLPFDANNDEYVLTVFNTRGVELIADAMPVFTLQRSGNVLVAQLIKRGETPQMMMRDITMQYQFAPETQGKEKGKFSHNGTFAQVGETGFQTAPIPLSPYTTTGQFAPYPVVQVIARDEQGAVLARTQAVVPVSSEMGCKNCHGGNWKNASGGGVASETGLDLLTAHDKRNKTRLVRSVEAGSPVACRSCHAESTEQMNLSTAIHGFHAAMLGSGAGACDSCHPSSPQGQTRFARDIHAMWELDCTRCHGSLQDHAIALLQAEKKRGSSRAKTRIETLTPTSVTAASDITPRKAWVQQPDCTTCHNFSEKPDVMTASAFNVWTNEDLPPFHQRMENTGNIRCASCHGSAHAVYPATSPMGDDRDNLQPLQYQKLAMPLGSTGNCAVCHKQPQEFSVHHEMVGQ